jgi:hypothetical protein
MHFTGRVAWVRILAGPLLAAAVAAGLMAVLRDSSLALAAVAGLAGYVIVLAAFEWFAFPDDVHAVTKFLGRAKAVA